MFSLGITDFRTTEHYRSSPKPSSPAASSAWQVQAVPDLSVAEDLLDVLEARGITRRELLIFGNSDFQVRWKE